MLKRNKEKGVTLIALVVTIIVLLILAGVSIAMLTGDNGIITNAKNSKNATNEAKAKEAVQVEVIGSYDADGKLSTILLNANLKRIEGLTYGGAVLSDTNKIEALPVEVELDGFKIKIDNKGEVTIAGTSNVNPGGEESGGGTPGGDDNPPADDPDSIVGKKYNEETPITVDGTPVTVPGGATISGIEEETTIDEGLVAYIIPEGETVNWTADEDGNGILDVQEKYDQFVWVPVPNPVAEDMNGDRVIDGTDIDLMIAEERYPMAIKTDETNYRGISYTFSLVDGKVIASDVVIGYTEDSYREPMFLDDNSNADNSSYNQGTELNLLQYNFNRMVQSVEAKEGFWVGRYETSHIVGTVTTNEENILNKAVVEADSKNKVKVIKGTTTGVAYDKSTSNCINWYRMYNQQRFYSTHANISLSSTMIWGSQWDQILIWMMDVKNELNDSYYVINALGMGNFGPVDGVDDGFEDRTSPAPTGCFSVKGIYDLEGNLREWTLEAYGSTVYGGANRVSRRWEFF